MADDQDIDMDDLQAAIEASAQGAADKNEDDGWGDAPDTDKAKEEPAAEEPAEEAEGGHQISVKIKKGSAGLKPKPAPNEDEDAPAPANDGKDKMLAHKRGKTIQPLSAQSDEEESAPAEEPAEEKQEDAIPEPEAKQEAESDPDEHKVAVSTTPKKVIEPPKEEAKEEKQEEAAEEKPEEKEEEKVDMPSPADNDVEEENGFKIDGLGAKKKEGEEDPEQNEVKVFDTKEYHLPIKANRHHRKGEISGKLSVVIVIAIVAAVVAYLFFATDFVQAAQSWAGLS